MLLLAGVIFRMLATESVEFIYFPVIAEIIDGDEKLLLSKVKKSTPILSHGLDGVLSGINGWFGWDLSYFLQVSQQLSCS